MAAYFRGATLSALRVDESMSKYVRSCSAQESIPYSWFLIFGLLTWMLASCYYPAEFRAWSLPLCWFMGAMTAIMLNREDVISFLRTMQELGT
jgi:hypothetical protein